MKSLFLSSLLLSLLFVHNLYADALMVNQSMRADTIIEFHVEEDGIDADLEIGLDSLRVLLREIIKRWPDVEFMAANELSDLIINKG